MPPTSTTAADAVMPESLLEIVRQIEDVVVVVAATATFNKQGVGIPTTTATPTHSSSEPLVHTTMSFIESAWNGSMCEKELGRNIPLAYAIQRSSFILDASLTKLGKKFPVLKKDEMGDKFSVLHFRKNCRMSLKVRQSRVCEITGRCAVVIVGTLTTCVWIPYLLFLFSYSRRWISL